MNVSTAGFSPTQMILAWTLLILLLSWFIIFTALAIHDYVMKRVVREDKPSSSRPIPSTGVLPDEEHHKVVEMAEGITYYERANSE